MHIFSILLIYAIVLTSHYHACVQGITYSINLQHQGLSITLEGRKRRSSERDAGELDMMQLLDGNGNKKVSADEMKAFWKGFFDLSWSEEDILLAFDQDSDGELDMEEFHRYEKEGDLQISNLNKFGDDALTTN